jgi:hypothetical protein
MKKTYVISILIFLCTISFAQDTLYSRNSLKLSGAIGVNETKIESGVGLMFSAGFQRSFLKDRVRINSTLMTGKYTHLFSKSAAFEHYRMNSLDLNTFVDVIKFRSFSLFAGTGFFLNNSVGIHGIGEAADAFTGSKHFNKTYYGLNFGTGFRVDSNKSRLAQEFSLFNGAYGNNGFWLEYFKFGLDYKLSPRKKNK